jgi:hypothetical protein
MKINTHYTAEYTCSSVLNQVIFKEGLQNISNHHTHLVECGFYPRENSRLKTHRNNSSSFEASEIKICITVQESTEGELSESQKIWHVLAKHTGITFINES